MLVKKSWPLLIYQRNIVVMEAGTICLASILFMSWAIQPLLQCFKTQCALLCGCKINKKDICYQIRKKGVWSYTVKQPTCRVLASGYVFLITVVSTLIKAINPEQTLWVSGQMMGGVLFVG